MVSKKDKKKATKKQVKTKSEKTEDPYFFTKRGIILHPLNDDETITNASFKRMAIKYYTRGNAYYDDNNRGRKIADYVKAIASYTKAIELDSRFSAAYFKRGLSYYQLDDLEKSLADYLKCTEQDPNNPIIRNNLANVYYMKCNYQMAIKNYNKAISLKPDYLKAFYNRGLSYASIEEYERAIEDFTKVIEMKDDFAESYHLRGLAYEYAGDLESAIKDYEKALALNPDLSEAKTHLESAKSKLSQEGHIPEPDLKKSPVEKILLDKYGEIGLQIYNLVDGKRTANEIMEKTGLTGSELVEMLDFMDEQGIIELDYPEKAKKAKEAKENAFTKISLVQELKPYIEKDKKQQITKKRESNKISPKDAKTYYKIGNDHYEKGDYEKAIENYNMAILLNPVFSEAYFSRAMSSYQLKNFGKSIQDYTKSAELDPKNPIIYNNLGDVYYRKEKYIYAILNYDKAISLDSKYMKAYYNRGLSYGALEKYAKAIEDFSKAISLKKDFAEAYLMRGEAYKQNGEIEKAASDFNKALELNSKLTEAKADLKELELETEQKPNENKEITSFLPKEEKLTFKDVAGMHGLKEYLRLNIIAPFRSPELAQKFRKTSTAGLLFYGPPGCGKTYIIKALAGELKLNIIHTKTSDFLNSYVGNTEKNIKGLFETARKHIPCVVFMDELDAIGFKRGRIAENSESTWYNQMVSELLQQMDQISYNKEQIVVVGATNMPWNVDTALKRSGRIEKLVFVPPPDSEARKELFLFYLKGLPVAQDLDIDKFVKMTDTMSCADIKSICESASNIAWSKTLEKGKTVNISNEMVEDSIGKEQSDTNEWFMEVMRNISEQELREIYPELYAYLKNIEGKFTVEGKQTKKMMYV